MTQATKAPDGARANTDDAAAFVERFAAAWRAGGDGWELFEALMHPDVLLTQPLQPPARGTQEFRAFFEALFALIPDLRGEVLAWGATSDGVLIDLELRGTVAGRPFATTTCDRIVLRDGLILERHARMDPLPIVRAALGSPRAALRMLRGPSSGSNRLGSALTGLAVGRVVLGSVSRLAPRATARAFGIGHAVTPELDYMTQVFGARAVGLGTSYLVSSGSARTTAQRIALAIDISDTLAGIGQMRRNPELPRASALAAIALTGTYAAIGAAKLARDLT